MKIGAVAREKARERRRKIIATLNEIDRPVEVQSKEEKACRRMIEQIKRHRKELGLTDDVEFRAEYDKASEGWVIRSTLKVGVTK